MQWIVAKQPMTKASLFPRVTINTWTCHRIDSYVDERYISIAIRHTVVTVPGFIPLSVTM